MTLTHAYRPLVAMYSGSFDTYAYLEEDKDFLSSRHWVRVPKMKPRMRRRKSDDRKLTNISDR